ncbi:MAG: ABC-F type ribosomal protection protein [Lachnospiraceae bacterium]|jgi:lincosamide and streptogramin A transport system ATP-binding/permease protein|nr:ABC-F type ribosomal protection protein [Lachnospiraceae bacterium]
MSLIQVSDLSFTYEGSFDPVFENVSFQIDTDWKLGLTGRNGRGKTTFLRLLQGEMKYTGSIASSVMFDYFPCPVGDRSRLTYEILEDLPGSDRYEFWELLREMGKLQMPEEVLYRQFESLSGGEQTKVLLAALFLQKNFLLIDEPTNHLDQEGRRLVSRYLDGKKGFILVSHDRAFLDGCVDHILAINRAGIQVQKGSYSSWQENRQRQDAFELAENERLKKEICHLQAAARQSRGWADQIESMKIGRHPIKEETFIGTRAYIGEKSRRMQQRRKNLERRQNRAIEEKQKLLKNVETTESLKLIALSHHSSRLVTLNQVAPGYGCSSQPVCQEVSMEVCQGDRIFLQGKNGCGKSTLLKLILGDEKIHLCKGEIWRAGGLKISYVSQDTSFLKGSLKDYGKTQGVEESLFLTLLRKLDFSREQFEKPVEDYSEGQKKKVLLAGSLCQQAHLYIWDEPLNYIDMDSRKQIEELILNFQPTMILVEHDEAFEGRVATKNVTVEKKRHI